MQDRDGALLVLNRRTRRIFPFISLSSLIPGAVPKEFGDRFVELRYRAQRRRYIGDKGHEVRPSLMRKAAIDCSLFP
jgi:hypothetical protein